MSEQVLDAENWKQEAQVVINDIKNHVRKIELSEKLQSTDQHIYLNLTTLENSNYCIELSSSGFTLVGNDFDVINIEVEEYYETPYSLLNKISPQYKVSFSKELIEKLNALE